MLNGGFLRFITDMFKLCFLGAFLQFSLPASIAEAEVAPDQSEPLIDRFHKGSKPFSEVEKIWSRSNSRPYISAMRKFPTVAECQVKPPEQFFSTFKSLEQIEICLFLVAEDLGDEERVVEWLIGAGAANAKAIRYGGHLRGITGNLSASQLSSVRSLLTARLFQRSVAFGISINIETQKYESAGVTVNWN